MNRKLKDQVHIQVTQETKRKLKAILFVKEVLVQHLFERLINQTYRNLGLETKTMNEIIEDKEL